MVLDAVEVQPVALGLAAVIVTASLAVLLLRAGTVHVVAVPLAADRLPVETDQLAENPFPMPDTVVAPLLQ